MVTKKTGPEILFYNSICRNNGNNPKCEGRFKRHQGQNPDLCPTCTHLSNLKAKKSRVKSKTI